MSARKIHFLVLVIFKIKISRFSRSVISPKICHCIHPFFHKNAPVSTPSSCCIGYSVIKDTVSYCTKYTMCIGPVGMSVVNKWLPTMGYGRGHIKMKNDRTFAIRGGCLVCLLVFFNQ